MNIERDRVVLLFFKDYERDSLLPYDRYLKRLIRPIFNRFSSRQKVSGFLVWCQLLAEALRRQGYEVHLNDYKSALQNPSYPVGLVGYPHLLDGWCLPNPAVLGPSLFDHPQNAPDLMGDERYKRYIVTCDWMHAIFEPVYGDKCVKWHAGIDLIRWNDTSRQPKPIDILIYDKIRWERERYESELLHPIVEHITRRGLTYAAVRYGKYDHKAYKKLLEKSRGMIFLCEHETQGMAYQEALSSNVPVLAWDNGFWMDPIRPKFSPNPIPASSVPYFSAECGHKFRNISQFPTAFDTFQANLDHYTPREFVKRELSFQKSAELYLQYYLEAATSNTQ